MTLTESLPAVEREIDGLTEQLRSAFFDGDFDLAADAAHQLSCIVQAYTNREDD